MKGHVREVKKEAEGLVASGDIEEFRFEHGGKHPKLCFRVNGGWHSVPFAQSPRTAYVGNFTRQHVRRVLRSLV